MLKLYKNIDIPPKSPFGKGGLGRFAPGAQIFRVSWLRSTTISIFNYILHPAYSLHRFVVKRG